MNILGEVSVYSSVYFFDNYAEMDGLASPGEVLRKAYGEGTPR